MRYSRMPKMGRKVTPRRIAAAERALRREREKHPLFAAQIAEEQPTPIERIEAIDASSAEYWQNMRDHKARTWRETRRRVQAMPEQERAALVAAWNNSSVPGDATNFASFVRTWGERCEERSRPLTDEGLAALEMLCELYPDWIEGRLLTPRDRLRLHDELVCRGLAERQTDADGFLWRATASGLERLQQLKAEEGSLDEANLCSV